LPASHEETPRPAAFVVDPSCERHHRSTGTILISKRVEHGPAGSHALSGTWRAYKTKRSKNGAIIRYRCTADGFSAETPLGEKYDAKFDGKDYPVEDDPAHTMVAVKLVSATTVEQTNNAVERLLGFCAWPLHQAAKPFT
jgi:hypothetical protein